MGKAESIIMNASGRFNDSEGECDQNWSSGGGGGGKYSTVLATAVVAARAALSFGKMQDTCSNCQTVHAVPLMCTTDIARQTAEVRRA